MEADWDLQAVVRGCATTSTTTNTVANPMVDLKPCFNYSFLNGVKKDESYLLPSPNTFQTKSPIVDLHELYKPFFPKSEVISPRNFSAISSLALGETNCQQQPKAKQSFPSSVYSTATASTSTCTTTSHSQTNPRSKRRKNQLKKVCQVSAEGLSSDIWSWRKYGQKPIKGSPYPRGYYRCSSSKGCLARKQVERNKSNPTMFIVTYTAEHNHPVPTHRNSLAGTTRHQKSLSNEESNNTPSNKLSSAASLVEDEVVQQQSTKDASREFDGEADILLEYDEQDEMGFSDTEVTDDFFEGLDEIVTPVMTGDCSSDEIGFPASFSLPFLASNAATAAGGS